MNKSIIAESSSLCWHITETIIPHVRCLFLWGPAGTGKTYGAQRIGLKPDQSQVTVTMTNETSAADLLGYYINTPEGYKWQDGPATYAWRTGARLVVNEIDHASGDAQAALFSICDDTDSAYIRLASGEVITPHANFSCIATSNSKPEDALVTEGMLSRFNTRVNITEPHPDAVARFPEAARNAILALVNHPDPTVRVSLRSFRTYYDLLAKLGTDNATKIAHAVFGEERAQSVVDSLRIASVA